MTDATPSPPPAAPAHVEPPARGLRKWALVAEVVSAAAVVISLVFVGLQINESNDLARSAATQAKIAQMAELSRVLLQTPGVPEILMKTAAGQPLTPVEQVQLRLVQRYGERLQEGVFYQYLEGRVDPELWEAHRAQVRSSQSTPADDAFWAREKNFYSPRYRAFREADKLKTDSLGSPLAPLVSQPAQQPVGGAAPAVPKQ